MFFQCCGAMLVTSGASSLEENSASGHRLVQVQVFGCGYQEYRFLRGVPYSS